MTGGEPFNVRHDGTFSAGTRRGVVYVPSSELEPMPEPEPEYRTIGFWRFIWHSIHHATHEITTVYDGYEVALYVCHECKVVTPAE